MKKLLIILLSIITATFCLSSTACAKEQGFTFHAPDGAPAVAIAKFINDKENFGSGKKFSYNVVTAVEIRSAITVKKADFVIMPVNQASMVYKDNGYVMQAVITHGNFYFVSSFAINGVEDLIGKVVCVPNPSGLVPDLTLKVILEKNSIEYAMGETPVSGKVIINNFPNGTQVIQSLSPQGETDKVAMLPEPAATAIKDNKAVYSYRYSVQTAYDSVNNSFPQAVLMVKKDTAEKHPEVVKAIADKFSQNVQWVKDNPAKAVSAVKGVFESSTLTNLTTAMIEGCNIYYSPASNEIGAVTNYLTALKTIVPTSANTYLDEFFAE